MKKLFFLFCFLVLSPVLAQAQVAGVVDCKQGNQTSGFFKAYFEEVALGNGAGYDHPTLGANRRQVACQVLIDVASMMDMNKSIPEILFEKQPTNPLPTNALAAANTYFPQGYGFYVGALGDHIQTGIDPIPGPGNFDAFVITNFYSGIVWNVDQPNASLSYDLYTVLLHEIMHALGFQSQIPAIIQNSHINGTHTRIYSQFDQLLHKDNTASGPLIDSQPVGGANHPYTDIAGNPAPALVSGTMIYKGTLPYVTGTPSVLAPIYSPTMWAQGSSLSHFDESRAVNKQYVMNPTSSPNTMKVLDLDEKYVLCQLGYRIFGLCDNQAPIGVDDTNLTTNTTSVNTEICIDFKKNDSDPEKDPFWLDSINIILGGPGAILTFWDDVNKTTPLTMSDPNTTTACFTPGPQFQGIARLQYRLTDGQRLSPLTDIHIDVNSPFCIGDPLNYVCNGDFEQGGTGFQGTGQFDTACPSITAPFWCVHTESPDLLGSFNNHRVAWMWLQPGPQPSAKVVNNDRFGGGHFGHLVNHSLYPPAFDDSEMLYNSMIRPLIPGLTYEFKFEFYDHYPLPSKGGFDIYISDTNPGLKSWNNTSFPYYKQSYVPLNTDIHVLSVAPGNVPKQSWTPYTATFTFSPPAGTNDYEYLIVRPQGRTDISANGWYFFDNVSVKEISGSPGGYTTDIGLQKNVNLIQSQVGTTLRYSTEIKNVGNHTAYQIVVNDYIPDPTNSSISWHTPKGTSNGLNAMIVSAKTTNSLIEWTIDQLAPNESIIVEFDIIVPNSAACETLRSVAIMTSISGTDNNTSNHIINTTTPNFPFTSAANKYSGTADSHVDCAGALSGYVYEDLNNNLTKDVNEPGLHSYLVELHEINGPNPQPVQTTISQSFPHYGFYEFKNVPPGDYAIHVKGVSSPWMKTEPPNSIIYQVNGDAHIHTVQVTNNPIGGFNFGLRLGVDVEKKVVLNPVPSSITVGKNLVQYTITVTNLTNNNFNQINLEDILPSPLLYSFVTSTPQISYNSTNGQLVVKNLKPHASVNINIITYVNIAWCGTLKNTVTLKAIDNTLVTQQPAYQDTATLILPCIDPIGGGKHINDK